MGSGVLTTVPTPDVESRAALLPCARRADPLHCGGGCIFFDYAPLPGNASTVLVVEPDYLPDAEVLCFQSCLYPMKYLHPRSMYTLPREGVQRGGTPSARSGGSIPPDGGSGGKRAPSGGSGAASPDGGSGAKPPKQKLTYKSIL
jgi:hypothetical protein